MGDKMKVYSDYYYIHKTFKGTYSIWSIDDNIEMCGGFKTRKEAEKILAIMPHSIVMEDKINDNKARTR